MEEVPRRTLLAPFASPCFVLRFTGMETEGRCRLRGEGGDDVRCTVEPSPSHIRWRTKLSGPDRLRFLRVALRIEISTRCVFCVAGRTFIGFLSLPNLVLKLNLNMPKRLRVEAAYRSKMLAYCGLTPRSETSGPANSSTKMAH